MISQDESTTLNIYVHYKVSKNIKIINWYCKSICMVIIPMVKFMQISFRQSFILKKGLWDMGGFNLFLIIHEMHPDCVNIYWGYFFCFGTLTMVENLIITWTMEAHLYSYIKGHTTYIHTRIYHICTYVQGNITYICIEEFIPCMYILGHTVHKHMDKEISPTYVHISI